MDVLLPESLLKSVDFPTFGLPTIAIFGFFTISKDYTTSKTVLLYNYFRRKMNNSVQRMNVTIKEYWKGILLFEIFGLYIRTK